MLSALLVLICVIGALGAPWLAPHNPFDLATLNLSDARLPPAWMDEGQARYLLGTDDQGRDILSALMYGARISLTYRDRDVVPRGRPGYVFDHC